MSETWAHVRTAEAGVPLTSVVAGITLALRHARTASRVGCAGLRFVINDAAERERVAALFDRQPGPDGLQLQFVGSDDPVPSGPLLLLDASAIYLRDSLNASVAAGGNASPVPDYAIKSAGDIDEATRFLFSQIRKSITLDGVIAYYVMRPLARVFTRMVLNTSISPNQATLAALACGLTAATCAAMGGATLAILAGLCYWMGGVLDCVDGELARLRLQSSKTGEWLDSMVDEFSTISLVAGLGIGLSRDGLGDHWLMLGFAGALLGVITLAPLYTHLHRQGLAIDTAQFPWFFGNSNAAQDQGSQGFFGKLVNMFGYLIRRDANITFMSILLILNLRHIALGIMLSAFVLTGVLVVTHYAVLASRKSAT